MKKEICFILLLCGIFSQAICSSSNENNGTSSDIHNRQKRVVGGVRRPNNEAPFLVTILLRGNYHSPATLLTADTAITSAHVFKNQDQSAMNFESRTPGGKRVHQIMRLIFLEPHYNQTNPTYKNLVLIKIGPPIHFPTSVNRPISIHSGNIVEQRWHFEVVNWEKPIQVGGKFVSIHCRAIPVQLVSIEYCQHVYPNLIGPGNICAHSVSIGEHGTKADYGAPLLVGGNLLGIMVHHGPGRAANPDVFMNLLDNEIRRWIHQHIPSLRLF